jgi:hypothetical protein
MRLTVFVAPIAALPITCAWSHPLVHKRKMNTSTSSRMAGRRPSALSKDYLDGDLVAIVKGATEVPRLCAVQHNGSVAPLCIRADDVETDL